MESLIALPRADWFLLAAAMLVLWSIPWKGYALWVAAKNTHRWWFVLLLLVNTVAILEIVYIFGVGRPALKRAEMLKPSSPTPIQ